MIFAILKAIIVIMILIGLGVGSKKFNFLRKEDSLILNKIVINLALPSLAFLAIRNSPITLSLLAVPLIAQLTMLAIALIALIGIRFLKLPRPLAGSFLLTAILGNTAFMGYPVIISTYGEEEIFKAVFYNEFGTAIFMFTLGSFLAAYYGKGEFSLRNILLDMAKFPPLIALFLAFISKPVPLPDPFLEVLGYLSKLTIPLIMISVGLSLDFKQIKQGNLPLFLALFLKLIFSPVLAYCLGKAFFLDPVTWGITILQAAMPVSMVSLSLAIKYQLDVDFASQIIFTSVLVSILTIPLVGFFLPH